MKMVLDDQKRVSQDYWKIYHKKVTMIFTVLVAYTLSAVKNYVDLWKNNKFAKVELPNSENNFKKYKYKYFYCFSCLHSFRSEKSC